jgi:hypothetical protein
MNVNVPPPMVTQTSPSCSSLFTKFSSPSTRSPREGTPSTASSSTSDTSLDEAVVSAGDLKRPPDSSASLANAKPSKSRKTELSMTLRVTVDLTDGDDGFAVEAIVIEGDDIDGTEWVLCQPTGTTSAWWKVMKKFHPLKHPKMKDKAACVLCFDAGNKSKGTIAISTGTTTGLMVHMQHHHCKTSSSQIVREDQK